MTEKKSHMPCCAADAMRCIHQIEINGLTVGFAMLDCIFEQTASLGLSSEEELKKELLRQVKIYNYVPRQAEEAYGEAIVREYNRGEWNEW